MCARLLLSRVPEKFMGLAQRAAAAREGKSWERAIGAQRLVAVRGIPPVRPAMSESVVGFIAASRL
jgi:hypothetical protein